MPITKTRILQSSVQDELGCWIWQKSVGRNGYGKYALGRGKTIGAHRASYQAFNGEIPFGLDVCHRCDVRECVNPQHLFVGTRSENIKDAVAKDRWHRENRPRGQAKPAAKLKDADIPTILAALNAGETKASLGRTYSVTPRTIALIKSGEGWKHIQREIQS